MISPHPADGTLVAYGLGRLADTVAAAGVATHLESCDPCRQRVADLSGDDFVDRIRAGRAAAAPAVPDLPPEFLELTQYDRESFRYLSKGGMGHVFLARNRLLDRLEVLKVFQADGDPAKAARAAARFQQEFRAAARLQHPNVVTAYAAFETTGRPVFAMAFVEGKTLAAVAHERYPLPVADACHYAADAAAGLQHAHDRGMVHRDIKPENLMLTTVNGRPLVQILDFGLAKVASGDRVPTNLTSEGTPLGTLLFMAPEQYLNSAAADIRADIYSLGCTLFCLLTGRPPFEGDTEYEIVKKHTEEPPPDLAELRPDAPRVLLDAVARMLAKDPADRFQTPGEVEAVLRTAAGEGAVSPFALSRVGPRRPPRPPATRIWPRAAAAAALVVGLVAGGVWKVRTANGTIVMDGVPAGADVLIDGSTATVTRNGETVTLSAVRGPHMLKVVQNGMEFLVQGEGVVKLAGEPVRVRVDPPAKPAPAATVPANIPPPSTPARVPRFDNIVTISAKSEFGYETGNIARGEVLSLEYRTGRWKHFGKAPSEWPDDIEPKVGDLCRVAICEVVDNTTRVLALVPGATVNRPFEWVADKDYDKLVLRINDGDGDFASNPQTGDGVKYRIVIHSTTLSAPVKVPPMPIPERKPRFDSDIVISAKSEFGYVTGKVARGESVALEYRTGRWNSGGTRVLSNSPDEAVLKSAEKCRVAICDTDGKVTRVLALVPGATVNKPFAWTADKDYDKLVLRINDGDGDFASNPQTGDGVKYRMMIYPAAAAPPAELAAVREEEGPSGPVMVPLFNGTDLTGWKTHDKQPAQWRVVNGVLTGTGPVLGYLYTDRGDYGDFRLRAEARINPAGDSGIVVRSGFGPHTPPEKPRLPTGYEAQISCGDDRSKTGSIYGPAVTGRMTQEALTKPGEWFVLEVIAAGPRFETRVNGQRAVVFTAAASGPTAGHIALQVHSPNTVCEFRKIEIAEVPLREPADAPAAPGPAADPTAVVSRFTPGKADGWTTINIDGSPGGTKPIRIDSNRVTTWLVAEDGTPGKLWGWAAPPKYRGDHAEKYGRVFRYTIWSGDVNDGPRPRDIVYVRLVSKDLVLVLRQSKLGPFPSRKWASFSATLDPAGGWERLTGGAATEADMRAVLADIKELWIRGEYRLTSGHGGLIHVEFGAAK